MKAYILRYDADDNETELEVELEGYITKYHPATMYKNNGDPGDPEEGGELEDFAVILNDKDITDTLSKEEYDTLELFFMENWEEPGLW